MRLGRVQTENFVSVCFCARLSLSVNKIRCGSAEPMLRAVEITGSMRNELHIRRQVIQPYRGALLVAEPFLDEGCFRRAVVCLAEYSEKGAVGFVLNSPTRYRLNELLEGMDGIPSVPVYCGGPVGTDHLFFLHDIASLPGAVEVATGLFANGDFDMLLDFLKSDEVSGSTRRGVEARGVGGDGYAVARPLLGRNGRILLARDGAGHGRGVFVVAEHPARAFA